tara:strand:- start:407 stop:832 length:426 start_codon:yes stop_codon:yes gene_type:complete
MLVNKLLNVALISVSILLSFTIQAAVQVESAWVRLLPPMSKMTAAYMKLTSDQDDRLISVSSDLAKVVEIHQSKMEGGVMSMQEIGSLALPKDETVELKPQSYHLMVMGLQEVLQEGDEYAFTLEFEHAEKLTIQVPVRKP